jgi:predicted metalloprotease with PDZ domain
MIDYQISSSEPNTRWIEVRMKVPSNGKKIIQLQLPSWRPGRYELGNFAKNISQFEAKGKNELISVKITKDLWEITNDGSESIEISYKYYATDWNAGSTYTCQQFLYVNPVNCLMYVPELINEKCKLEIQVPSEFELAMGYASEKTKNGFKVELENFHQLADAPFIAGTTLQKKTYHSQGINFHVWFNGECKPDWTKILRDFEMFTNRQIKSYGQFTCKEYHFFIHALPFSFYHGVEHQTSSVNALGPGYAINEERYEDLLGLCSHELYHSWNIKSIRPAEMHPYRYETENYFRTGYVAEGVTTYMGDLMLYASEVFDHSQYFKELSQQLQKHVDNAARLNYSVADSGFDSWLDGYVPGVPDRKVSIYTEGCLIAFMCDVLILDYSNGTQNLDHVMKELYEEFYLKNKGYTSDDYRNLVEKYAGRKLPEIFDDLVFGKKSYLPLLETCLEKVSLKILKVTNSVLGERVFGMKVGETPDKSILTVIYPDSPASKVLSLNDQIIAVNKMTVKGDLQRWLNYFANDKIILTISRSGNILEVELKSDGKNYFEIQIVSPNDNFPNELAKSWRKR